MGKRELVALLDLSSWCHVMVEWLFLAVPWDCLWSVIVVSYSFTIIYDMYMQSWSNSTCLKTYFHLYRGPPF